MLSDIPEEDDDKDHAQAMIDWLADKNPDVWFEVTQHLNWDSSGRVLDWIISQPRCDKANAASVFWGANPLYYLRGDTVKRDSEGFLLLDKVLRNWKAEFYTRAELAWSEDWRAQYSEAVAARRDQDDPLSIPNDLLGPLHGRAPNVPDDMRAENNVDLYDLLYALGTDVGWRPGSAKWHGYRDPIRRRKAERRAERSIQRAGILFIVRDILGFWWRSLRWIAPLSVVIIGGAFVLRWMVKGVLF